MLEAVPICWMSLSWIPKDVLENIRKIIFRFLWSGCKEKRGIPLVEWQRLIVPKDMGDWELKNIFRFSKIWQLRVYGGVDSVGPANIQRGLPNMWSQLDLTLFGIGAPSRIQPGLKVWLGSNCQQERGTRMCL